MAVIIIAALGIGAVLLLSRPQPSSTPPPSGPTLDHVTVTASGATSFNQVATTTVSAAAIDSNNADQSANATFAWSATPASAVVITRSPTVAYVAKVQGILAGGVTITATATWHNVTKSGNLSLTVTPLHYALRVVPTYPLVGTNYTLTLSVDDASNTVVTSYTGTVDFSASAASNLTLPPATTFTVGFGGTHSFTNITILKPGAVTITATDSVAPTVTGSVVITGNRPPIASFALTFNSSDPRQISVDASSSYDPDPGDSIAYYAWSFGDGIGTGTGVKTTYAYATAGTYTVTLFVRDTHGAANDTSKVYVAHAPPTAVFYTKSQAANGASLTQVWYNASDSVAGQGHVVSYNWTFGDGSPYVVTTSVYASHNYSSTLDGHSVLVNLTVMNNYSVSNTLQRSIEITTTAVTPVANFSFTYYFTNKTVLVDASNSSSPAGYKIMVYAWNWGDSSPVRSGPSPTGLHAYATTGTFTITLTVTDSIGTTGSVSHTVVVQVPQLPPVAIFNVTRSLMSVSVDANATYDINNNIANYTWDWGDGAKTGPLTVTYAAHSYSTAGYYTITLTVIDTTNLVGTTTRHVSVSTSTLDYSFHDFFNVPYGDWWDMRRTAYGDEPLDANCFNVSSTTEGYKSGNKVTPLCSATAYPSELVNESYPYTNWYPSPFSGTSGLGYSAPHNDPFIYAPYRFNVVGVNTPGYNVSEPVFLPVLSPNYAQPADLTTPITFNWHMQYMNFNQWNGWSSCVPGNDDGFMLYNYINVTLSLQESRRIFNVPSSVTPSTAQAWWNSNAGWGTCTSTGTVNSNLAGWFNNEGNNKYDIWNSFQYPYTPFFTEVRATVNPSTGTTTVEILHAAWGTEVLLARWFYWGNASYASDYLDSTKAAGWWGMELAWFEDLNFTGTLSATGMDFALSAVLQYHFQIGASGGSDGNLNQINDVPYWIWWPMLSDYVASNTHPSELARYAGLSYLHSTPGSYNYNRTLPFDYVPLAWKLKVGQTWHFQFPRGKIPFYDPNNVTIPQDPHTYPSVWKIAYQYGGTTPTNWGFWSAVNKTWDVYGGEPSTFTWSCNCPYGYAMSPQGQIWLSPNFAKGAVVASGPLLASGVAPTVAVSSPDASVLATILSAPGTFAAEAVAVPVLLAIGLEWDELRRRAARATGSAAAVSRPDSVSSNAVAPTLGGPVTRRASPEDRRDPPLG